MSLGHAFGSRQSLGRAMTSPALLFGSALIGIGAVSLWDACRLTSAGRRPETFDSLGPDRYLMVIAGLLIVLGLSLVVKEVRIGRNQRATPARQGSEQTSSQHLWLLAITCAYAGLMLVVGYAIATLAFFIASFWIMEHRVWYRLLPMSILASVLFVLLFQYFADMELPKGYFEIGFVSLPDAREWPVVDCRRCGASDAVAGARTVSVG